jgi:outer membrane protein TolC
VEPEKEASEPEEEEADEREGGSETAGPSFFIPTFSRQAVRSEAEQALHRVDAFAASIRTCEAEVHAQVSRAFATLHAEADAIRRTQFRISQGVAKLLARDE